MQEAVVNMKKNHFLDLFKKAKIDIKKDGLSVHLDVTRFGKKLDSAQDAMKEQFVQDMLKYVPTGDTMALYNEVKQYNETSGERDVVYAYDPNGLPYSHYQHEGVLYVDPITGKGAFYNPEYGFWSRPDTPKVQSTRLLNYSNPNARRDWLRYAAEHDREDVVNAAKRGFRKG